MKLKETRILDAEGARYACIANDYCTRCDCEEYDRILADADTSSRKPGGITVDDLARIAEAIKAVSETDDDVPAIAFALSRRIISHFGAGLSHLAPVARRGILCYTVVVLNMRFSVLMFSKCAYLYQNPD